MNKVNAQTNISGTIVDAKDGGKLERASIALINAKDSILVRFTRAKENGSFVLPQIDTGLYKVIVTYPQYADYVKDVHLTSEALNMGTIRISKAALLLEEVQVNGKIPVVIKGDTIEYDAGSFKVEKDAKVEDLLKVLPGITMDATGKITAQGKEVKKVLLDGEEFFGDDPTLITKNIRSDMVSKVQVYEKKSDLAVRTGVDDGERTQTIDIKLKEDKKKGLFGQAVGGLGTDDYYGAKVMVNKFKGSQKIAAYGILANDGMVGLGFEDGQKYGVGGSGNVTMMDGGGIMISSDGNNSDGGWDGKYYGSGVPKALNYGASYSDKTTNDKHKININYKRNQLDVENRNTYMAQNNLPGQARIDNSITDSEREDRKHTANLRYDLKLDSLSDLTVNMGFNKSNNYNSSKTTSDQQTLEGLEIYKTNSTNNSDNTQEAFNANLLLTRRFKKPKRSLTLNLGTNINQSDGNTQYFSNTEFTQDNKKDTIDQFKRDENANNTFNSSLTYTEPLSKRLTGSLGYSFSNNKSETLNQSFDQDPLTGKYTILDQNVLNDFDFTSLRNGISTSLNYKDDKFTINASNQLTLEEVKRDYNNLGKSLSRNQTSFSPSLSVRYQLSKSKSFSMNYRGNSLQPSLTQIEPLKQNTQQTITYLDNPDLSAGFRNSYSINYNSYKQLKDQNLYFWFSANQGVNNISSKVWTNLDNGRQRIEYVNLDRDNWSVNFSGSYGFPINKKMGLNMNLGVNTNYNSQFSYMAVNNGEPLLNRNESWRFGPSIGLRRNRANKMDFYFNTSPGFEKISSTLQPTLNRTAFSMNSYMDMTYYLPKNFKISINANQNFQSATNTLQQINVINVTGFISKKFLKDKSLEAQLFVNDIFNQNNGVYRYQSGTSFIQSTNDVLRRYGMLKVIYNFTTMKGDK